MGVGSEGGLCGGVIQRCPLQVWCDCGPEYATGQVLNCTERVMTGASVVCYGCACQALPVVIGGQTAFVWENAAPMDGMVAWLLSSSAC